MEHYHGHVGPTELTLAHMHGVHPHPTTLLKLSLKEFSKSKKEGVIKTL